MDSEFLWPGVRDGGHGSRGKAVNKSTPWSQQRIIDGFDFGRFFQELSNFDGHGVVPQPPCQAVSDRGAATYFSTEVSVSNYATFGGPAPRGGSEEEHVDLAFNPSEKENALQSSTLYGLSPSLPHNSPFASTPPEVYGGASTWWDDAALPNTTFGPPPAPEVSATVDSSVLNGELSDTRPGLYCDNLPAASGHAFGFGFGEKRVDVSAYKFSFHVPSGQSFHPFPGYPNPNVPPYAFVPPEGQYAAQEFVRGSSSEASPLDWPSESAVTHPSASIPFPIGFDNVATHMPSASLSNPPPVFTDIGYASTPKDTAEIFSPRGDIAHRDGEIVGPSASSSRPRKRKAPSTCSTSSSPKAKAAKLSSESSPSHQEHTEADEENHPADSESPLPSKIIHKIDWSRPPTWAGNPIPPMAVEKILSYLNSTYKVRWDKILCCEFDDCRKEFKKAGAVKSHVMGAEHMDLRRKCLRCGWSVREDNFSSRHDTRAKCDRALKRRERKKGNK